MTFPRTRELTRKRVVAASFRKSLFFYKACEDSPKFTGILPSLFLQLHVPLELL